MKIEYTNRAVADLRKVSADSRMRFGDTVAAALEKRVAMSLVTSPNIPKPRRRSLSGRECACFR
jgi:hypothetical protein